MRHCSHSLRMRDSSPLANPHRCAGTVCPTYDALSEGEEVAFEITKLTDESLEEMVNASMSWQRKLNGTQIRRGPPAAARGAWSVAAQ